MQADRKHDVKVPEKYGIQPTDKICGFMSQSTAMAMSRWSVNLTTLESDLQNISCSISSKEWDWAGMEITTPGSVDPNVLTTDCALGPGDTDK